MRARHAHLREATATAMVSTADRRQNAGAGDRGRMGHQCPDQMAQGLFARLTSARYKRLVEIGEGTHMVLMEKNRRQAFDTVLVSSTKGSSPPAKVPTPAAQICGASPRYFTSFDAGGGRCFPGSDAPINFVQAVMHAINFSGQVKPACFAPPWARVALSHKSISLSHLLRHALSGSCAKAVPTRTVSATANMQHRTQLILISLPPCGLITIVRGIIPCRVFVKSSAPLRTSSVRARRKEPRHR
jgi:hypothetical protein